MIHGLLCAKRSRNPANIQIPPCSGFILMFVRVPKLCFFMQAWNAGLFDPCIKLMDFRGCVLLFNYQGSCSFLYVSQQLDYHIMLPAACQELFCSFSSRFEMFCCLLCTSRWQLIYYTTMLLHLSICLVQKLQKNTINFNFPFWLWNYKTNCITNVPYRHKFDLAVFLDWPHAYRRK